MGELHGEITKQFVDEDWAVGMDGKNISFIGDKSKRIPGSGRAEDVCWDRQGHRRVVCPPIQCTPTQYTNIMLSYTKHNFRMHRDTIFSTQTVCPRTIQNALQKSAQYFFSQKMHWDSTAPKIQVLGEVNHLLSLPSKKSTKVHRVAFLFTVLPWCIVLKVHITCVYKINKYALSFEMAHIIVTCECIKTPLSDVVHWGWDGVGWARKRWWKLG